MSKMLKVLDKLLLKFGLIRSSVNKSQIASYKSYTQKLGQAAKEAGVKVLFEEQSLTGVEIDTDLFILGNRNSIVDCWFTGSKVLVAPQCSYNYLSRNSFTDGKPVEFYNFTVSGKEE